MRRPSVLRVIATVARFAPHLVREVVVSDFDATFSISAGIAAALQDVPHKHLEVFVDGCFNKSVAANVGAYHASSDLVLFCDADVILSEGTVQTMLDFVLSRPRGAAWLREIEESENGLQREGPGIILLFRSDVLATGGYCSEYIGWGLEDRDFLMVLSKRGIETRALGIGLHLSHDDSLRTSHYGALPRAATRAANAELLARRTAIELPTGTLPRDVLRQTRLVSALGA